MRLIPGKTKVSTELFKGVKIMDMVVAAIAVGLIFLIISSTLPGKLYFCIGVGLIAAILLVRFDVEPNYAYILHILKYLSRNQLFLKDYKDNKKAADIKKVLPYTGINEGFIEYGGEYYGAAIEIPPVEFRFFSPYRRVNSIESGVGRVLRSISGNYSAEIVKLERPVSYDAYIANEYEKLDELRKSYEQCMMKEDEFKARTEVMFDRINELESYLDKDRVISAAYYIVLFDSDKRQLSNTVRQAVDTLTNGELKCHRLDDRELALFLKYSNTLDFDEHEVDRLEPESYYDWTLPDKIEFRPRTVEVNGIISHTLQVVNYPLTVGDAWLAGVMSIPSTKVVVKCKPMDRSKALKNIDFSLQELRGQYSATGVDSKRMELATHIETLNELLATLQADNESLLACDIYITAYDVARTREIYKENAPKSDLITISNMKKTVKRMYQESNLKLGVLEFLQMPGFIASQISGYDPFVKSARGIPSNTVAACYPWIYAHVSDEGGIKLGSSDGVPVFINFFRRDSERVNSNMVIVGKSGSGKSYATKSLLTNLAADDSKIFILDPENEYSELATNLHGKFINVGNAQYGRLNPFHIITTLDDEEGGGEGSGNSYATHLQFLEEFFKQILPDCEKDAMEYLNSMIDRVYYNKGITEETDLSKLKPEDYPIFDDLYDTILQEFQQTDNEYIRRMLRTLMNYISKFSSGGRNATIWNGPSSVTTEENFTVFNFQSLLANRNGTIANAQMLLVLKYIDNEIIKNREYNTKYGLKRKVVVVIDEAHVFIDTKFPVALDFMFQLAKRIRKYNGMQIVITQNIKDFVGSEEIARKSTAIINACQYSFVFSLAPNDMDDLCKLYEKAGGINEVEQEQIVAAPRGQAFTIMSAQSRSTFKVEVPGSIVNMFQDKTFESNYFQGEDGEQTWDEFVGESRIIRESNVLERLEAAEAAEAENAAANSRKKTNFTFVEITEEEAAEAAAEEAEETVTFTEEAEEEVTFTEETEEVTEEADEEELTASEDEDFDAMIADIFGSEDAYEDEDEEPEGEDDEPEEDYEEEPREEQTLRPAHKHASEYVSRPAYEPAGESATGILAELVEKLNEDRISALVDARVADLKAEIAATAASVKASAPEEEEDYGSYRNEYRSEEDENEAIDAMLGAIFAENDENEEDDGLSIHEALTDMKEEEERIAAENAPSAIESMLNEDIRTKAITLEELAFHLMKSIRQKQEAAKQQ